MEIMTRNSRMEELREKIRGQEEDVKRLKAEMDEVEEGIRKDQEVYYVPHLVTIESFQRALEGDLKERGEKKRKREEMLDSYVSERQRNLEMHSDLGRDQERIENEIDALRQSEVAEDEEIAACAMQIRATLSKRASLRSALEDARRRNRDASANMDRWEEVCMKLADERVG